MTQNRKNWTQEQDQAIIGFIKKYGSKKWALISQKMKQRFPFDGRSGKQCRERWHNHLCPKINKQPWTKQELKLIFDLHRQYGNKWTQIAKLLKGRTDNSVKNQYYSTLRKGLRRLCKVLGANNSTTKIKKIKPNVLSKIISNFTQFNFGEHDSEQQFYDILFELSNQDRYEQMKESFMNNHDREKMQYVLQKILQSKSFTKSSQSQNRSRNKNRSKQLKTMNNQKECESEKQMQQQKQINSQSNGSQQKHSSEQVDEFDFNVDFSASQQTQNTKKVQENRTAQKQQNAYIKINSQQISDYDIFNEAFSLKKKDSILSIIKDYEQNSRVKGVSTFVQKFYIGEQNENENQNNQNFYKCFFAKSPCFQNENQFGYDKGLVGANDKITLFQADKYCNEIVKQVQARQEWRFDPEKIR